MPPTAYERYLEQAARRRERAAELQAKGKTLREIGAILGVSHQRAAQMINEHKAHTTRAST